MALKPSDAFISLPVGLRNDLLGAFNEVVTNFEQGHWGPASLDGGKLCEATITILQGLADNGNYEPNAKKPANMVDACKAMEQSTAQSRSVRIQIPRMIVALYEIRNNRGVGHVGGDVDPNEMDATAVLYMCKWIMAELVRIVHTLTTVEAAAIVESLIERQIPVVWSSGLVKRVITVGLTWKQQTLLLLVNEPAEVHEELLISWLEHPNASNYRQSVLRPGHKSRLWEYDAKTRMIKLLPPGILAAEVLLKTLREKPVKR